MCCLRHRHRRASAGRRVPAVTMVTMIFSRTDDTPGIHGHTRDCTGAKGSSTLNKLGEGDIVVLDKTGTVTTGHMGVVSVHPAAGESLESVLSIAGPLEDASEHPIARAIAQHANEIGIDLTGLDDFANHGGNGVSGVIDGHAAIFGDVNLSAATCQKTRNKELVIRRIFGNKDIETFELTGG